MLMSYILNNFYKLKNLVTTFITNARIFHYSYDRGSLLFKSIFVCLC